MVKKAVNMAAMLGIPILRAGGEHELRGVSPLLKRSLSFLAGVKGDAVPMPSRSPCWPHCPIDPALAALYDEGRIEEYELQETGLVEAVRARIEQK